MAQSLTGIAQLDAARGAYDEAEAGYQRSRKLAEQALGKNHPNVGFSLLGLAQLRTIRRQNVWAEEGYKEALRIWGPLGDEHPCVARCSFGLSLLHDLRGDWQEAISSYQRALEIWRTTLAEQHPDRQGAHGAWLPWSKNAPVSRTEESWLCLYIRQVAYARQARLGDSLRHRSRGRLLGGTRAKSYFAVLAGVLCRSQMVGTGASIVSIGARTPVGLGASGSAAAIRAGIQRLAEHPFMVDARGEPLRVARDALLDPKILSASHRIQVLARSALDEAIGSGIPHLASELGCQRMLEVVLALPEERPGFSDRDAARVAEEFTAGLHSSTGTPPVTVVTGGHAGGLEGLRLAVERVVAGRAEICAVVGADSYLATATIDWLDSAQRIAADKIRGGFTPGEAGSCVLVATRAVTQKRNLRCLATILAAESAHEPNGIHGDREGLGVGLTAAIAQATDSLADSDGVDGVYCDINGERYRSDEWGFAVLRIGAALKTTDYVSAVRSCGDVGASSGPLLCGLAIRAWARHYAAGPRALVWCSSESGLRAAVVLERGDDMATSETAANGRR